MRTLRARLIFSHLLPILIVVPLIGLAAFVLLQVQRSITNVEAGVQQQAALLQEQAQLLSNAAGRIDSLLSDPAAAAAFLASINLEVTGVTLLDAQGRVVAATNNAPPAISGGEGQVAATLRGQGAVQVEVTGESGRRLAELAIPVLGDQRQVEGVLLLSQELTSVSAQVGNLSTLLIAIVVILFVLGILLGLLLALRLSRSLGQVTGALEGIRARRDARNAARAQFGRGGRALPVGEHTGAAAAHAGGCAQAPAGQSGARAGTAARLHRCGGACPAHGRRR